MFLKTTEFAEGDSKLYWVLYDHENAWLASFDKRGCLTTGLGLDADYFSFARATVKYLKRARKL